MKLTIIPAMVLISLFPVYGQTPLQIVENISPEPVVVIPDERYRELGELVADEVSNLRAEETYNIEFHSLDSAGLLGVDGINIMSDDINKFLIHHRAKSKSWNPDKENSGIKDMYDEYIIYNDLYISKISKNGITITPVYYIVDINSKIGKTILINGERYFVINYSKRYRFLQLARAKEIRLYNFTKPFIYKVSDNTSISLDSYTYNSGSGDAIITVFDNNYTVASILIEFPNELPKDITEDIGRYFSCCRIYITEAKYRYITIVFVDKKSITLTHGSPAFGYDAVWIPGVVDEHSNSVVFLGKNIELSKFDIKPLLGTSYLLKMSDFKINIVKDNLRDIFNQHITLKSSKYHKFIKHDINISLKDGKYIELKYMSGDLDSINGNDFLEGKCISKSLIFRDVEKREINGWMWNINPGYKSKDEIYNDLFAVKCTEDYAEVEPVMVFNLSIGKIATVNGTKYLIEDYNGAVLTLIPVKVIRLYRHRSDEIYSGKKRIIGDIWAKLYHINNLSFDIMLFNGDTHITTLYFSNVTIGDELMSISSYIGGIRVFIVGYGDSYVDLAIQLDDPIELTNGDSWLGYSKIRIRDPFVLLSGEKLRIFAGDLKGINNGPYYISYANGKLNIVRQKTAVIGPGDVLFADSKNWSGVIKRDIWFGIRVKYKYPNIRVSLLNEPLGDNIILLGTPEDNALLRTLMYYNLSSIDWYRSYGDVEVITLESGATFFIIGGRDIYAVERAVNLFIRGYDGVINNKLGSNDININISISMNYIYEGYGNDSENNLSESEYGSSNLNIFELFIWKISEFITKLIGG